MSGSLKSLDKKIAKRRQVYKPVLDNPFTNEAHMWPRVHDQPLIWQLLQSSIINKLIHIQSKENYPWELYTDFNEIVQYLSGAHGNSDPVCLFAARAQAVHQGPYCTQIDILGRYYAIWRP